MDINPVHGPHGHFRPHPAPTSHNAMSPKEALSLAESLVAAAKDWNASPSQNTENTYHQALADFNTMEKQLPQHSPMRIALNQLKQHLESAISDSPKEFASIANNSLIATANALAGSGLTQEQQTAIHLSEILVQAAKDWNAHPSQVTQTAYQQAEAKFQKFAEKLQLDTTPLAQQILTALSSLKQTLDNILPGHESASVFDTIADPALIDALNGIF